MSSGKKRQPIIETREIVAIPARQTFYPVLRGLLLAWGALALIGTAILVGYMAYQMGPGNSPKVDRASASDIGYVANWAQLGSARIAKVLHSYQSARAANGDHVDAYAIQMQSLSVEELSARGEKALPWQRGDQLPPVTESALLFAQKALAAQRLPWFPALESFRSPEVFIYPWNITLRGEEVTDAQIIIARPADRTLFYFAGQH